LGCFDGAILWSGYFVMDYFDGSPSLRILSRLWNVIEYIRTEEEHNRISAIICKLQFISDLKN